MGILDSVVQLNDQSIMTNLLSSLVEFSKCNGNIPKLTHFCLYMYFSCISTILKIQFLCP